MRGIGKQKKNILLLGIAVLILGMVVLPALLPAPTGTMSGGFMKDGEPVGTDPLLAFTNPEGVEVDAVWYRLEWFITGEFVDWNSFHIEGSYGIDLWHYATGFTTIFEETFLLDGEEFVTTRSHISESENLAILLAGQPYSASDADVWHLVFWGDFTTWVDSTEGQRMYDSWDGETGWLTVYWTDMATFGGSGTVTTDSV